MSSSLDYADFVIRAANLRFGQTVEIVSPKECSEIVKLLTDLLLKQRIKVVTTYTNEVDEYYAHRSDSFYDDLIDENFARITVISSFIEPRSPKYISHQTPKLKNYFHENISQRVIMAYPNEKWANMIGISYLELKNRIIDLSLRDNLLSAYIDSLAELDIVKAHIKNDLGTDLKLEFTYGFRFSDAYLRTSNGVPFKANVPSLEIFAAPDKYSLNGIIVGSKPVYVNNRVITGFSATFKDGRIISSKGLESLLNVDESLRYVGELGIAFYSDFVFYNTLLDENLSTHIALGNAYKMGVRKKEFSKINESLYHIDLPIGDKSLIIEFMDKDNNIVAIFKNEKMEIL